MALGVCINACRLWEEQIAIFSRFYDDDGEKGRFADCTWSVAIKSIEYNVLQGLLPPAAQWNSIAAS